MCVCVCGGGSLCPCNEDESDVNFLIWAGLNMQRLFSSSFFRKLTSDDDKEYS